MGIKNKNRPFCWAVSGVDLQVFRVSVSLHHPNRKLALNNNESPNNADNNNQRGWDIFHFLLA